MRHLWISINFLLLQIYWFLKKNKFLWISCNCVYVLCTHTCLCVLMWRPEFNTWGRGFDWELTYLTRLVGQYIPGVCLSLHPPNVGTELTWFLHGCWCFKFSFSHLNNKHIAWRVSPSSSLEAFYPLYCCPSVLLCETGGFTLIVQTRRLSNRISLPSDWNRAEFKPGLLTFIEDSLRTLWMANLS